MLFDYLVHIPALCCSGLNKDMHSRAWDKQRHQNEEEKLRSDALLWLKVPFNFGETVSSTSEKAPHPIPFPSTQPKITQKSFAFLPAAFLFAQEKVSSAKVGFRGELVASVSMTTGQHWISKVKARTPGAVLTEEQQLDLMGSVCYKWVGLHPAVTISHD